MPRYRILRQIPEVFEVEADTYDLAVEKIETGEVGESESMSDTYELVEEIQEPQRDPDHLNPAKGGNKAADDYW